MKTPAVCPKCRGPLLNSALTLRNGSEVWKKTCGSNLNHEFICITKEGDDNSIIVIGLMLNRDKSLKVCWDLFRNQIIVHKGKSVVPSFNSDILEIPWFEPNLDEYDNLVNKIKKYVVFS